LIVKNVAGRAVEVWIGAESLSATGTTFGFSAQAGDSALTQIETAKTAARAGQSSFRNF